MSLLLLFRNAASGNVWSVSITETASPILATATPISITGYPSIPPVWNGTIWCGAGYADSAFTSNPTMNAATSTDGVNWTQNYMGYWGGLANTWGNIAWSGTQFCLVIRDTTSSGNNMYSSDGVTWYNPTGTNDFSAYPYVGTPLIIYDGGAFRVLSSFGASSSVWYASADPSNWSNESLIRPMRSRTRLYSMMGQCSALSGVTPHRQLTIPAPT